MKQLTHYPQFLALTRPPMFMRVTQTYFILNVVLHMMLFMVTKNLLFTGGLFIIMHSIGVVVCRLDEYFFEILFGKFQLLTRNHFYFGCNSYDPS